MADTPAVMVSGPRQAGKTTLLRSIRSDAYVTLDLATPRAAAAADPEGFLADLPAEVAIDEIQRVPELFLALKAAIDSDRRPGRFLLSGSSNVLTLPRVADALPGRMELLTLWPFSGGEMEGRKERFVERVFKPRLPTWEPVPSSRSEILDRVLTGGYPDVLDRRLSRREAWFDSYLTALVDREAMEVAAVADRAALTRLVRLLAARNASVLNVADLARDTDLAQSTARRYLGLLQTIFLLVEVPAWSANLTTRTARAPKTVLCDTGVVAHVLGLDRRRLTRDPALAGGLIEGFVAMELLKQLSWTRPRPRLFHFRTATREVDLVLEQRDGSVVGIEVKAASAVRSDDFRGLRALADLAGDRFVRGIVLHTGTEAASFGARLQALPIQALWHM